MATFSAIDLAQLAPPDVVEQLDFEAILAEALADLRARDEAFDVTVESDPAYKILEEFAYRETLLRQRTNDAALGVMLAYATGDDLDQIGANYNVERLVITPADPDAVPPVDAVLESDDAFRARIQLSPEGYTTAGSRGSYKFHALSADGQVLDAQPVSPTPGVVNVYVLSQSGNGEADEALLDAVDAALNDEEIRPMTDQVTVQSVAVTEYTIDAVLTVYPGPDSELVRETAEEAAQTYADSMHRIGYDVTFSGLYAALHQAGVQNVQLNSPAAEIIMGDGQAAYCASITVAVGGSNV